MRAYFLEAWSSFSFVASRRSVTTRLALEVIEAIDSDPMYGPAHDRQRQLIGVEYEVVLEYVLREMGKRQSWPKLIALFPVTTRCLTISIFRLLKISLLRQRRSFERKARHGHQMFCYNAPLVFKSVPNGE
jgi:hypothetical protein